MHARAHLRGCMHAGVCVSVCVYTRTSMRAHVYVRARVSGSVRARVCLLVAARARFPRLLPRGFRRDTRATAREQVMRIIHDDKGTRLLIAFGLPSQVGLAKPKPKHTLPSLRHYPYATTLY